MLPKRRRTKHSRTVAFFVLFILLLGALYYLLLYILEARTIIINPVVKNTYDFSSLIEKKLENLNINFSSVSKATESSYLVTLPEGKLVFSGEKDIDVQISSLQLIIKQLTIEGKRFKRIDFRFDKPVITIH